MRPARRGPVPFSGPTVMGPAPLGPPHPAPSQSGSALCRDSDDLAAVLRTGPFHEALRSAIKASGLSLQRVQARLGLVGLHVGVATLSYWQQGQRRPERPESLRAVRALEQILGLPASSLTVLLGPPRPRGRGARLPRGTLRYDEFLAKASEVTRLLEDLGDSADAKLHTVSLHERVYIGPDRGLANRHCLHVVQAHQPTDRHVAIWELDPGADTELSGIRAVENCRVGRVLRGRDSGFLIAELLFDRLLQVGDTHALSYEFFDSNVIACTEYRRGFRFPARNYVLQVGFHPDSLPVRCTRFAKRHVDGPVHELDQLTLDAYRSTHLVASGVASGVLGISWEWE